MLSVGSEFERAKRARKVAGRTPAINLPTPTDSQQPENYLEQAVVELTSAFPESGRSDGWKTAVMSGCFRPEAAGQSSESSMSHAFCG